MFDTNQVHCPVIITAKRKTIKDMVAILNKKIDDRIFLLMDGVNHPEIKEMQSVIDQLEKQL